RRKQSSYTGVQNLPSEGLHRSLAGENESLAGLLLDVSPSWSTVVTFYAALHWIDAFLASKIAAHPETHQQRTRYLSQLSELHVIERTYLRLRNGSEDVRYSGAHVSRRQAELLIRDQLGVIRSHVLGLIGP